MRHPTSEWFHIHRVRANNHVIKARLRNDVGLLLATQRILEVRLAYLIAVQTLYDGGWATNDTENIENVTEHEPGLAVNHERTNLPARVLEDTQASHAAIPESDATATSAKETVVRTEVAMPSRFAIL